MQVFIRRSDLAAASVRVVACYEEETEIDPTAHGPGIKVMSLPRSAVVSVRGGMTLAPGWQNTYRAEIAQSEAERRIATAFPDFEQASAALELAILAARHGGGQWPKEAQRRREEIEGAWAYINAVRQAAKRDGDPFADGHWPK